MLIRRIFVSDTYEYNFSLNWFLRWWHEYPIKRFQIVIEHLQEHPNEFGYNLEYLQPIRASEIKIFLLKILLSNLD